MYDIRHTTYQLFVHVLYAGGKYKPLQNVNDPEVTPRDAVSVNPVPDIPDPVCYRTQVLMTVRWRMEKGATTTH